MAYTENNGKTQAGINAQKLDFRSSDPSDPGSNQAVQWVSDGTGSGAAGDVMMKINSGGTVKTVTLIDFSAS